MAVLLDTHVLLSATGVPRQVAQDVQTPLEDEDSGVVQ